MKKKSKARFLFEKVFSSSAKETDLIKSPQTVVDARKLLPELEIPKSETAQPDGTVVKSLFLDYFPDEEYLIAQILRRGKQQYEREIKEFEALSADSEARKKTTKKHRPKLQLFSYN